LRATGTRPICRLSKKQLTLSQYKLNHFSINVLITVRVFRPVLRSFYSSRVTGAVGQDNSISIPVSLVGMVDHTPNTLPTYNTIEIG